MFIVSRETPREMAAESQQNVLFNGNIMIRRRNNYSFPLSSSVDTAIRSTGSGFSRISGSV